MLAFLLRWAYAHDLRLKLFNPCRSLPDRLEYAGSIPAFKIPTLDEMIASWPVPIADIEISDKEMVGILQNRAKAGVEISTTWHDWAWHALSGRLVRREQ